ncbi:MAG: M1 family metallopeptidase [Polyangiaceae bacterium]
MTRVRGAAVRRKGRRAAAELTLGVALTALAAGVWAWLGGAALAAPEPAEAPMAEAEVGEAPEPSAETEGETAPGPDVVDHRFEVSLDTSEHRLKGEGRVRFTNHSRRPLQAIWLHLYLNAFKNERTVFMRSTASRGFRGGARPRQWGYITIQRLAAGDVDLWEGAVKHSPDDPDDETDIEVPLHRPLAPGETLELDMAWTAQLPSVVARTGFFEGFHMVAQWFPKLARLEPDGTFAHFPFHRLSEFYADYGRYDVTIDVPKGVTVGATGVAQEPQASGDRMRHRFVQDRVHDFAFAAWDAFVERTAEGPGGVKLRALVPPGDEALAELELEVVEQGMRHYGERFGDYPYDTLTVVHPPRGAEEAGGMEYPTLITTGGRWYQPLLGRRDVESVTFHELAHQWFYGIVGSNEHDSPFLDEGLTTWATLGAAEARDPGTSAFAGLGLSLGHPAMVRAGAAQVAGRDDVARSARDFATGADYGGLVYGRTATTLETLDRVFPGRITAAVGSYARRFRFRHPEPADLVAEVKAAAGERAAQALEKVLFERGRLDFAVGSMWSEELEEPAGIFGDPDAPASAPEKVAAHAGVVIIRRLGEVVLPVDVELHSEGGEVQSVRWDGEGPHHTIVYRGDTPLASVVIDPEMHLLLDEDLSNNVARRDARSYAPRLAAHAGFFAQLLLGMVAP